MGVVGAEPSFSESERIWSQMRTLLDDLLAAPQSRRERGTIPGLAGVYLLNDGERYRYVGQTRNLRNRLGQHMRPSGGHNSATLAFLMAVRCAGEAGIPTERRSRRTLQADPQFAAYFDRAKATVATWSVQFVRIDDPLVRTVFEVYVHSVLATDLNSFETH